MCINPLRIRNKGYRPSDIYTSPYVDVGCGHCWQCKQNRSNDYAFRLQYELFSTRCIPFFVTLTYSPQYLPILEYWTDKDHTQLDSISVWNRTHIQRLHKVLRRQLQYYYGFSSDAFKYLVCCERGTDRTYVDWRGRTRVAQKLPHYHALYMLHLASDSRPVRPLPDSFYDFCRYKTLPPNIVSFFQFLLHSRWFYGHVDDIAFCRDIASCTRYVAKYITKDINESIFNLSFNSLYNLVDYDFACRYNSWLSKNISKVNTGYYSLCKKAPRAIRFCHLLPRSVCSANIGMGFVNNLPDLKMYLSGFKRVPLVSSFSSSLVNLPYYYFRKLCKKVVRIRYGQPYTSFDGKRFHTSWAIKNIRKVGDWDNLHGCGVRPSVQTYSQSSYTSLGLEVRRLSLLSRFKRFKNLVSNFYRNSSSFELITSKFDLFDNLVKDWYCLYPYPDSIGVISLSLKRFVRWVHGNSDPDLSNLFNYLKVCSLLDSHLKHLAHERKFTSRLCSVALDNPDLFLSHNLNF